MALFHCNFYSYILGYDTQVNVVLPENRAPYEFDESKDYRFQVLYLLHGLGDDCNGWVRNTAIERYACEHRIAVIMPTGEDSFYLNKVSGKRYFDYMTEELPAKMKKCFPLSRKQEDTFIAGLSMGGYGTLKIGLTYPERFAGMAFFSGVTIPSKILAACSGFDESIVSASFYAAFGKDGVAPEDDPSHLLAADIAAGKPLPKMVQYVGKQDFIHDINTEFRDYALSQNVDLTYDEWDGSHEWKFWDAAIEKALNALPLKNAEIYL